MANHEHNDLAHVAPMKVLLGVFLALVILTVVTVMATWVDLGRYNLLLALAIAVVKATMVVMYFMHLRYDKPFNAVIFVGCLVFVAIFISLSLLDTGAYKGQMKNEQAPGVKAVPDRIKDSAGGH